MSLEVIYITRHGFRSNWVVNPKTGEYSATVPSPTGIPSDPALAGKGEFQAQELAAHLVTVDPPIQRFYSSPFYRCLQTIDPTLQKLASSTHPPSDAKTLQIHGENGVGEWFGSASFEHPSPATPTRLHELFPRYSLDHEPVIIPSTRGETIDELHDRTAYALHRLIEQADREGVRAILICTHAATLIAIGRTLTGRMPMDVEEEDFHPFTCSLSTFIRRKPIAKLQAQVPAWVDSSSVVPSVGWRESRGVGGGWDCVLNGDCSFLSGGEERGWRFSGDESFRALPGQDKELDAGFGLGVVVEGKKKEAKGTSRL